LRSCVAGGSPKRRVCGEPPSEGPVPQPRLSGTTASVAVVVMLVILVIVVMVVMAVAAIIARWIDADVRAGPPVAARRER
jgi:hypothetical protein